MVDAPPRDGRQDLEFALIKNMSKMNNDNVKNLMLIINDDAQLALSVSSSAIMIVSVVVLEYQEILVLGVYLSTAYCYLLPGKLVIVEY